MFRMREITSAQGAIDYHKEALCGGDYHTEGQTIAAHWHGETAEKLGIAGQAVTTDAFAALCHNRHPIDDTRLTPRTNANRRVLYDMTFSAPKDVSILHFMTGDERIARAVEEAANFTMGEIQAEMKTRVRVAGRDEDRLTGNLVWSTFLHRTTRPIDGYPDPQLHAHCPAMNLTWDQQEQRYKAGQFGDINRDAPYFDAIFHNRLSQHMHSLGYPVSRNGRYMGITGMPQSLVDKFSRRKAEVEAMAAALGITDDKGKDQLGATTRQPKLKSNLTNDQLFALWKNKFDPSERAEIEAILAGSNDASTFAVSAQEAVDYALKHRFERSSVSTDKEVLIEALQRGFGSFDLKAIKERLDAAPVLSREVSGRKLLTTEAALHEEREILRLTREGRDKYKPLGPLQFTLHEGLNAGQADAVSHLLQSRDRIMMIRGGAGTGKTTALKEAVRGIHQRGKEVYAFAPTADASRRTLRAAGFPEADTVAKLLQDRDMQASLAGQVILVDEAGMLSNSDMLSVLRLADSMNSRVILVGDTRQHSAVSRGDAMRLIENEAGIRPAEIHEVMRQSGDYKRAITAIASGDVLYGFDLLDKQKAIIEQPDVGARYHQLIDEVLAGALDETLVVAPTNREAETVTSLMRHELKKRGALGTEDTPCRTLKNLNWTEAQRTDQAQYRDGMVLVFHQRANGVGIGEQLTITGLSVDSVPLARNRAGQTVRVPIDQPSRFSVFEERTLGIAPGDMIRMKRGSRTKDRKHELMNGRSYCVKAVRNNGDIELQNGWVVDKDFGGFDYGYVTTSYSSQGRTVNRVFVAEDSHSGRAASTEQFYVSASRGRREVKIFTDNKDALKESIQRSAARPSATELMQGMVTGDLKPKSRNDTMRAYGAWMRHHMRVKQQNPQFVAGRSDDLVQEARRDAFRSMGVDR